MWLGLCELRNREEEGSTDFKEIATAVDIVEPRRGSTSQGERTAVAAAPRQERNAAALHSRVEETRLGVGLPFAEIDSVLPCDGGYTSPESIDSTNEHHDLLTKKNDLRLHFQ